MSHREEALKLRGVGLSYGNIGFVLGMSPQGVHQLVNPVKKSSNLVLEDKLMLSMGEAAKLIGVHINTLRRWANQGIIKSYRIGNRGDRRFRREDIDRFLDG